MSDELRLPLGEDCFAQGWSRVRYRLPERAERTDKIFVPIRFGTLPLTQLAQLDTGAAYSIVPAEIAETVGFDPLAPLALDTRLGRLHGLLARLPVRLVADEGESLDLEATFFVANEWDAGVFLGLTGLLDRIRFALDPESHIFYFGA